MPKRRNAKHSAAFREEAVRQARTTNEPLYKLARDLGINYGTLRWWSKEANEPKDDAPVTLAERQELRRLREEVRELRMERDILKKLRPSSPNTASSISVYRGGEGPLPGPRPVSVP